MPFDINVILNLSSDATGNHEIIKQVRTHQFYLSVHQTRDKDVQTNSHSICTHFSFFWTRMQVNLLSRQTKQSICKKNKTQFQHCTKHGAVGNWTLESRYQRRLSIFSLPCNSNIIQIPSPIFQLGNFVGSQKILNPACTGPGYFILDHVSRTDLCNLRSEGPSSLPFRRPSRFSLIAG